MKKLSQAEVYTLLRTAFMRDYHGHFQDDYDGQNKLARKATWYAVLNTVRIWRNQ